LSLFGCKLLTDANVHPLVVQFLGQQGCDVKDVATLGLGRAADDVILAEAGKDNRIVLTHDRDFGRLAVLLRQPMYGIVFCDPATLIRSLLSQRWKQSTHRISIFRRRLFSLLGEEAVTYNCVCADGRNAPLR
jgi:predicted nuclease of predicted toxin-antitoxin system